MELSYVLIVVQLLCAVVMCVYFFNQTANQRQTRTAVKTNSDRELEKLRLMRSKALTIPLSEKARPTKLKDIVGQQEGIRALMAALCGPNPQHVIIYGPPGVGKTCAARIALQESKGAKGSPFRNDAPFIEMDATCVRFDERAIADPLIGSVHDPIYQGAGSYGQAGVPQPKAGAVTKANGGVLFLDEIGELHPIQMNKLLKVLEDRKVMLESAYYSQDDENIPMHIHDIFQNGLPADFRLVGATTRQPQELPPAIRSRCIEVFFRSLKPDELARIAADSADKCGIGLAKGVERQCAKYSQNGRDSVNLVQLAAGIALNEDRKEITLEDIQWVAETCRFTSRGDGKLEAPRVGQSWGLAVTADGIGAILDIEATARRGTGRLKVTGIVEEEEISAGSRKMKRKSMASASVETVLCALRSLGVDYGQYDININFPGGTPVDGPSAGLAIATAVYSAIKGKAPKPYTAMTGEVSIHGMIKQVGGVNAKLEAAVTGGAARALVPAEGFRESYRLRELEVTAVSTLKEAFELLFELPKSPSVDAYTSDARVPMSAAEVVARGV